MSGDNTPIAPTGQECPYNIKALKYHKGREGIGFNLNLYCGKTKVAEVADSARGGDFDWSFLTPEHARAFYAYLDTLPLYDRWAIGDYKPAGYDPAAPPACAVEEDDFVDALINRFEEAKQKAKMLKECQTKTPFRLKSTPHLECYVLNLKFTPTVKEKLTKLHGDDLLEFLNETLTVTIDFPIAEAPLPAKEQTKPEGTKESNTMPAKKATKPATKSAAKKAPAKKAAAVKAPAKKAVASKRK